MASWSASALMTVPSMPMRSEFARFIPAMAPVAPRQMLPPPTTTASSKPPRSIALEISRAHQFFFTSTPFSHVDHIILAGGCAVLPGLLDIIANRTKISTALISPFKGMELSAHVKEKQLRSEAPSFLVACGLAMRRFD